MPDYQPDYRRNVGNNFGMNSYGTGPLTIEGAREGTASLLAKVLGITSAGFLVTAVGVATAPAWSTLPGLLVVFALIFGINYARRANPSLALGLFFLLAYAMGWEIGPLIHRYLQTVGPTVVFNAAATTGLGMAVLGSVAYLFNINYRRLLGVAMAALIVVFIIGIASIFFHFIQPSTYSFLILGVFSLLTVGDFARIRAGGDGIPASMLALSIYLDGINIFLAVLQLFGGGRRRG